LGQRPWLGPRGAHRQRSSAQGHFRVEWWECQDVAWSREHWAAAGAQASLTPTEIVGWATAEVVGTDSGTVHNRMSSWRSQSSSRRAAGQSGSGPGAVVSLRPTIRTLGTSSEPRLRPQGWAGILSRAIVGIGSHSFASLHDRTPVGNFMRLGQKLLER
jgi:hypothetical protein